jgi:6-phosphogluconolactonase (cycloisomerase 2 family)
MPRAIALAPSGNELFVTNAGDNSISAYTVDADGSLSASSGSTSTGTTPAMLAINPAGTFLFAANNGSDDISAYSVSGTTLTAVAGSPFPVASPPFPTHAGPFGIAIDSTGSFLYVSNQSNNTVTAYTISSSGALAAIPGGVYSAGTAPSGMTIAHQTTGGLDFLYATNQGSNNVSAFVVCNAISTFCSAADGTLVAVSGSPFSAGLGPISVAAHPNGQYLYVADEMSNQISEFTISTGTGGLSATSPATISTGTNPVWIAVHPGGLYAYAANLGSASISAFIINTTTGTLGLVGSPVQTGGQPSAIALK